MKKNVFRGGENSNLKANETLNQLVEAIKNAQVELMEPAWHIVLHAKRIGGLVLYAKKLIGHGGCTERHAQIIERGGA
jgi:hypothetical protein